MSAECDECGSDLVGSQYDERGLWCVPCDYKHQLAEAQGKGVFLWRTMEEWLLLQRIFGGSASEEHITNLERQLTEAQGQIEAVGDELAALGLDLAGDFDSPDDVIDVVGAHERALARILHPKEKE